MLHGSCDNAQLDQSSPWIVSLHRMLNFQQNIAPAGWTGCRQRLWNSSFPTSVTAWHFVQGECWQVIQLRKIDLIALSEASTHHHTLAAERLWQSVTIKPSSEDNLHKLPLMVLPQPCLRLAKQLHFHADLLYATASLPSCSDIKRSVYPLVSLSNPWAQPRDTS